MGRIKVAQKKNKFSKLVAIVGPSASGKTFLAKDLAKRLGIKQTLIISQDQYYKDWSKAPLKKREKINFDHPDSFDLSLMYSQLRKLKEGDSIDAPIYSYSLHKRLKKKIKIFPREWVIVEGLLVLHKKPLKELFDIKIYLDINKASSLSRRIKRDLQHREETVDSVCKRYFEDVLPMQKKYVESQRHYADMVMDGNRKFDSKLINILAQKFAG